MPGKKQSSESPAACRARLGGKAAMKQTTHRTTQAFSHSDVRSILIGLMLVSLLGALAQTMFSVALPMMAADTRGVDVLAWVVSAIGGARDRESVVQDVKISGVVGTRTNKTNN